MVGSIRALPNAPAMKREVEEDWGRSPKRSSVAGAEQGLFHAAKIF